MKVFVLISTILLSSLTYAQQLRIRGDVTFKFENTNIKAGEDYSLTTESKHDGVRMDVKKLKKNNYWYVQVNKSDAFWDSRVKVLVRRTNNGSGNGYLWGGNNFMEIRSIPQRFVEGRGILNNIYLQYRLTGISTEIPSGTYSTNIVYTLYER